MNKKEIAKKVAEKHSLGLGQANEVVGTVVESIIDAIAHGEEVVLRGLGTFKTKTSAGRTAFDIVRKEKFSIPARKVVKFSVSRDLKEKVSKA